ncbi:MAG: translocation/assembly module TamB domain-containing protein [Nitrospirota bacterium]
MDNPERIKKLPCIIALALLIGIAIFFLRGPYISNALKKIILPELELASGKNIIAKKIYINIFPLFIEAKGLKVFDENGERIIYANRVKAYIDLSGLLNRNIKIRRLVIKEPEITADRKQIEEILKNVKTYLEKERETPIKVKVIAVEVQHGRTDLRDDAVKTASGIKEINGEIILSETPRIRASAREIKITKEGWPEIKWDADVILVLKDGTVQINRFIISSLGSSLTASGEYREDTLNLKTTIKMMLASIKNIFKLQKSGEGNIRAAGEIKYAGKTVLLDLKLEGRFYLQTLMELLKVKEKIEGLVDVNGEIKGPINDITGKGAATLHQGNLFNVEADYLKCEISYADGEMKFSGGESRLYNGQAKASASIRLPVVDFFTLDIDFLNVDSTPLFKLIGWDPGIQKGKVRGRLQSAGKEFNPGGWFVYKNTVDGKDVLGRIKDISGNYNLNGSLLSLSNVQLSTGMSDMSVNGQIDIDKEMLNLDGVVNTKDITDISSPYYKMISGKGNFTGKISGFFKDPIISGNIKVYNPVIENYEAGMLDADVDYRKDILKIKELALKAHDELHKLDGSISFKKAKELFDLSNPEYKLNVSLKNADLEKFAKIFYADFSGTGRVSSELKIGGTGGNPTVKGASVVSKAVVYGVPFDSSSFEFSYKDRELNFAQMKIKKGKSLLNADASIDTKGNFSFKAASDRIMLSDMVQKPIQGDITFSLVSEGHGTFDNPAILVDAKMISGTLKGRHIGSGSIKASIKNRDISAKAGFIDRKINITANGKFTKEMPWDARIDIQTGRYDFLVTSFLKDVPEDLILSLNGAVEMHGDRRHVFASSSIKHMILSMYGYSFTNEKEIKVDLKDREVQLHTISMRGGNTTLNISGGFEIGKQYNLVLEGTSALSPFKSLSKKIGHLKGDAELVLSITGDWDTPKINGGLTLSNGAFGLKDYYHRISSLNGYLYIDNDKVVLQKLSGKLGGGGVDISGILYLKKFSFRRFYVEAKLDDISTSISNDFSVNFGGNILYKGTPASQIISGDIIINRARYRERVEWKSWLLKTRTTEKYKAEISNLEKAELNIRIAGKENIYIDNNVARATLTADTVLRGTIYRPILFGRLESKEGTVYFRNNEFRVLNASADFADPNRINPIIEIAAETVVKGYKIKMNLEGQLDHFNMSLSSDPPLKEMDILALLTVGQTGGELKGLEGGIGAGEATSFVTGKLQDVIEERLKAITGLDRFQIDPYVSKNTGAVEPRVTVSKRLLGDKVFVTYTSAVGATEEQIIKLEYYMGKNVSLIGVRDERGILGGDIRFRFEFK